MVKRLYIIFLAILPSKIKIWLLNRNGHVIDKSCRIGICYLDIERISLAKDASISSGNFFKGLKLLELGESARIGGYLNWFTASPLHQQDNTSEFGQISIGSGSNITSRHFFDAQQSIKIGEETLIAGFNSTFWTHGYRGFAQGKKDSIEIGSHCYIGSHAIFVPGARIADNTVVGAGSVITKDHSTSDNILLAGNPAVKKRQFTGNEDFFMKHHSGFKPISPSIE